eukprot:scaffold85062_cov30-Phaeocystis_antarctica.AAC.1
MTWRMSKEWAWPSAPKRSGAERSGVERSGAERSGAHRLKVLLLSRPTRGKQPRRSIHARGRAWMEREMDGQLMPQ